MQLLIYIIVCWICGFSVSILSAEGNSEDFKYKRSDTSQTAQGLHPLLEEDLLSVEFHVKSLQQSTKNKLPRVWVDHEKVNQELSLSVESDISDEFKIKNDINFGAFREKDYRDLEEEDSTYWRQKVRSGFLMKPVRQGSLELFNEYEYRMHKDQRFADHVLEKGAQLKLNPGAGYSLSAVASTEEIAKPDDKNIQSERYKMRISKGFWKNKFQLQLGPEFIYENRDFGNYEIKDRTIWFLKSSLKPSKNTVVILGGSHDESRIDALYQTDTTNRLFGEFQYSFEPEIDYEVDIKWKTRAEYSMYEKEYDGSLKDPSFKEGIRLDFGPSMNIGENTYAELLFRYRATKEDELGWISDDEMIGFFLNSTF